MHPMIRAALREDLGSHGDVTTRFFVPETTRLSGRVLARQSGIACGAALAEEVFKALEPRCRFRALAKDGGHLAAGQIWLEVSGGRGLLTAERTALNFLQHLCGIATLTSLYVEQVRGTRAKIFDTRKTLPGWRELEKYAVRCGGGSNHRMGLYDAVMLKDNHWACGGDIARAAAALRRRHPKMPLEIEADDLSQVRRAIELKADIILLDNMGRAQLQAAIGFIRRAAPKTAVEISGGVNLKTVRALALLGPDRISVGRITHSAPSLDLSLELSLKK